MRSVYNYFRDYDPSTGRYIQADPIGIEGGINVYGYANQNPLTYTDPTGQVAFVLPLLPAIGDAMVTGAGYLAGGATLAAILNTSGDTAKTKGKEQCNDDDGDDCKQKASDWELRQAGIDAHAVKKGLGQVSLFEICKCKSGGFAVKRKGCQGPIIFRL